VEVDDEAKGLVELGGLLQVYHAALREGGRIELGGKTRSFSPCRCLTWPSHISILLPQTYTSCPPSLLPSLLPSLGTYHDVEQAGMREGVGVRDEGRVGLVGLGAAGRLGGRHLLLSQLGVVLGREKGREGGGVNVGLVGLGAAGGLGGRHLLLSQLGVVLGEA